MSHNVLSASLLLCVSPSFNVQDVHSVSAHEDIKKELVCRPPKKYHFEVNLVPKLSKNFGVKNSQLTPETFLYSNLSRSSFSVPKQLIIIPDFSQKSVVMKLSLEVALRVN